MLTIPLFHNWPSIPTLRTTTSLNSSIVTFRIETSLFCQSQNIKFISSRWKVAMWKPSTDNCICTTPSTIGKYFFSCKNKYQYQTFKYIVCFYVCFFFKIFFLGKGVFVVFVLFCFFMFLIFFKSCDLAAD